MLERDYLMQLINQFIEALRRSWLKANEEEEPLFAAASLERLLGQACGIDAAALLNLTGESMANVLKMSGLDSRLALYCFRSLYLSSHYYAQAGEKSLAQLRAQQARALAESYCYELPSSAKDLMREIDGENADACR